MAMSVLLLIGFLPAGLKRRYGVRIPIPIGSAAVHKGLVTFDACGTVTVQMLPMRSFFAGSQKNGIESLE